MTDRYIKLLLLAIAVGLWMNVAVQWVRPVAVQATSVATDQNWSGSWENASPLALALNLQFSQAVERVVEQNCEAESDGDIYC